MLAISQPHLPACTTPAPVSTPQAVDAALIPQYGDEWRIGVLYGPHGAPDFFTHAAIDEFFAAEWQVHYNSNRLGVRLVGPNLPGRGRTAARRVCILPTFTTVNTPSAQ